ncbi:hypothetical protein PYW08_002152 [Mythimna loreyi]|uniref:Uncharacterized protein n=3 Tax=Mythimna loreyi TaxID=667449 RepID=A0ACC2Q607_9NEOP|nr:hypothetical protein PYW08_016862 [Mythimna loreyi]KAJ8707394.1 hypothetical protein PYW08_010646 [Mythimna loreyi]KAJ8720786.1 hypothetical protein PYW08_006251 [Mythimna loreyi]KAJ8730739.1 hypothetical protein PYW08_002152 [Mythimna loreyi]
MSLSKPSKNEGTCSRDSEITVWNYFKKQQKDKSVNAECTLCSNILKISKGSYKGLKTHLQTKHCIDLSFESSQLKRPGSDSSPKPSTSKTVLAESVSEEDIIPKKKSKTIDIGSYFKKENSMEMMVSRMVCKDGVPLSLFCTSADLRYLFSKSGFKLPNSPNTIRSIVLNFANTVKADLIIEFEYLKKQGKRFSLSFDEWTSQKNHRYLNLNVHHKEKHFNLGLIRIHGSCTAEHTINLIENRLKSFGLDSDTDIIGMSTDGASVMVKVGKLMKCYQQLCYAHGLQLAVIDVLYKKREEDSIMPTTTPDSDSDTDDEDTTDDTLGEQGVSVTITDPSSAELIPRYDDLLQKVRKVVQLFKRSPTKYDIYLQKYVKEDTGKELSLILDCRTRWNSLLAMIERVYKLKVCIDKALIDIGSDLKFNDLEWSRIKDLIDSLQPFKLAVETLCRRDSTLLTAETTLKFVLEKLLTYDTALSTDLSEALHARIKERRTIVTGILIYLQNPKKYQEDLNRAENTFTMPKKKDIRLEMKKILERFNQDNNSDKSVELVDVEETVEKSLDLESLEKDLTLQEELKLKIQQEMTSYNTIQNKKNMDFDKILKKEMTAFESEGVRGEYLSAINDYLLTIKPTSVEAERAFSAAGYICSSIRSRLGDDTINTICFLRSFFQSKK